MAEKDKKKTQKKKCPIALKRIKQSQKINKRNRSFKSRVRTAMRAFKTAVSERDQEQGQKTLSLIYRLMDKGVKLGIYKKNKAARTKSRAFLFQKSAL